MKLFVCGWFYFSAPGPADDQIPLVTPTPTALYALPHAPQGGHKGTAGRVSGDCAPGSALVAPEGRPADQ